MIRSAYSVYLSAMDHGQDVDEIENMFDDLDREEIQVARIHGGHLQMLKI